MVGISCMLVTLTMYRLNGKSWPVLTRYTSPMAKTDVCAVAVAMFAFQRVYKKVVVEALVKSAEVTFTNLPLLSEPQILEN